MKAERVTAASQVDHIVSEANASRLNWPPEQVEHESDIQAICSPVMRSKTRRSRTRPSAQGNDRRGWMTGERMISK